MAVAASYNNKRSITTYFGDIGGTYNLYYVNAAFTTFTARSTATGALFANTAVVNESVALRLPYGIPKYAGIEFNISTAMVSTAHTIVWEYRKIDGTWAAFTGVVDNTVNFTVVGVNSVTWNVPDDWATNGTAVNGHVGSMWVRARLSVATNITNGGAHNSVLKLYDNTITLTASSDYDSGTASYGGTTYLTDTTKAWTVDGLINRHIYIHTGTNAGKYNIIVANTATQVTFLDTFTTACDSTSQYVILANFEDLYQADVSAGWGKITKAGNNSYAFNCFLALTASAFGSIRTNIEFSNDYAFFCDSANTSRYPMILGYRVPPLYGLDKAIMGNNFIFQRKSCIDNRAIGFSSGSDYLFSFGNNYIARQDYAVSSSNAYLKAWFSARVKQSIGDRFEGWRSVTWTRSSGIAEVRGANIAHGYSGIEQLKANFYGVNSYYNEGVGMYLTGTSGLNIQSANISPLNSLTSRLTSSINYYNCTSIVNLNDYKGARHRPMLDVYGSTPNTFKTHMNNTFRTLVCDEKGNLLSNAKVEISDSLAQNRKTYVSFDGAVGNNDTLIAPNATSNQFSGSTAFSFEAWVYPKTAGGSALGRVIEKGTNGTVGYGLYITANNWTAFVMTSSGAKVSLTTPAIYMSWSHIVVVWNGSTLRMYVNTVDLGTVSATGTATDDTASPLYIGSSVTASRTFDGFIRRVRIFRNKALSSDEKTTLWNNGVYVQNETSPVSGCTEEYNFTEGTGTTVADSIGGNTATFGASTAAPTWIDTTSGMTANAITTYTGTLESFKAATAVTSNTYISLTSQPSQATRLRFVITNFRDVSTSASSNSSIQIAGTNANGDAIADLIFLEAIGNGEYITTQEFLTVDASGIYVLGFNATIAIDNLGITTTVTVKTETWATPDDVSLTVTDYNPILIKVSRPGFETLSLKKEIHEQIDGTITLKKSILDLT